jgi:microcystin-dependent protein
MSESYIGEVRLVGFNFAPADWAFCNGNLQSISGNSALYNLIGTTYGGDGQGTFGLPNLQGRIPLHQGSNGISSYTLGQQGGSEMVTLLLAQYPGHSHSIMGTPNPGNSNSQSNNTVGSGISAFTTDPPVTPMNGAMVGYSGSNGPHENRQPYQVLNWIISLYGVYPSPPN